MSDFNAFSFDYRAKFDAGALYTVLDPWGKPAMVGGEPVSVRVAGEESARFKNIVRELRRQNADKVLDDDAKADVALSIVVGCTLSWENVLGADGEPLTLTPESARKFWCTIWPFNGEQVAKFIREKKHFLGPAPNV